MRLSPSSSLVLLVLTAGCFPRLDAEDAVLDGPAGDVEEGAPGASEAPGTTPGTGGTEDDGNVDDDAVAPTIETLSPTLGSTAGGTVVEIVGGPFDETTNASFCGEPATVDVLDAARVEVETPALPRGVCDVVVETDGGVAERSGAFVVWPDRAGETIAMVSWVHHDVANPTHWSVPPSASVRVDAAMTSDPDADVAAMYAEGLDRCVRTDGATRVDAWAEVAGVAAGETVDVQADERWTIDWDEQIGFYRDELPSSAFGTGDAPSWFLGESPDSPSIAVDPGIAAPAEFVVSQPDVHGAAAPMARAADFRIRWTGSAEDYVGIDLWDLGSDRRLRCTARDDGDFTISAALLSDFDPTWVELVVTRYAVGETVAPATEGTVQVQVGSGLTGAVWLVP